MIVVSEQSATALPVPANRSHEVALAVLHVAAHHVHCVVDADPERDRIGDEVRKVDLHAEHHRRGGEPEDPTVSEAMT